MTLTLADLTGVSLSPRRAPWLPGRDDPTGVLLFHSLSSAGTPTYCVSFLRTTQLSRDLILGDPSQQTSHSAQCSHELHVLINLKARLTGVITSGSVHHCLSGPLRLTRRLSELLLSLAPTASVYHEERAATSLACSYLFHFQLPPTTHTPPQSKMPLAFPG